MSRPFLLITCLMAAINTGMGLIVPVLPVLLKQYGVPEATLSLPFFGVILGRITSRVLLSRIIGAFHNRAILCASFALYALTFLGYVFCNSYGMFVLLRFCEGVVEGSAIVCLTDMAIVFSPGYRGKLMGLLGASSSLGFIIGPLIGGICYKFLGLVTIFYAGATIGGIGALVSLFTPSVTLATPEPKKHSRKTTLMKYAALLPSYGPNIMRRVISLGFMILFPLYATDILHLTPDNIAWFFSATALLSTVLLPYTGRISDAARTETILCATLLCMACLITALGFTSDTAIFSALFFLISLCSCLMVPAAMKIFADNVDGHKRRTDIVSMFSTVTEVVTLFAAMVLPAIYAVSPRMAWLAIGICCVVTTIPLKMKKFD